MSKNATDKVWEAFCKDIPKSDHGDVLTLMSEAAHGTKHDCITILDSQNYDAINAHAHGIIDWKGREYSFHVESGNWNGTQLLGWEEVGEEFEHHKPTVWGLQPTINIVGKAVGQEEQGCKVLLFKWHVLANKEPYASLAGKYAYDRMMQPGNVTEKWNEQAAKGGFEIVPDWEAEETRKRLESEISDPNWMNPWKPKQKQESDHA